MARIRTIKPEFFTSDDTCSLSPLARLLYVGLWCEADREGRLVWAPRSLKRRYLPDDNCSIEEICGELTARKLVLLYGEGLAYIPSFSKHQHVNPRETPSKLPPPPGHFVSEASPESVRDFKRMLIERDGEVCRRCAEISHLDVDHILPSSAGGPHVIENMRLLCRTCNRGRPVAGQGLIDDLAKDGLTIEGLREKFGLHAQGRVHDASNLDWHAQVGREGKEREGKQSIDCSPAEGGKAKRKSMLPDDFEANPERLEYARAQDAPDPADTFARFKLHHQSKGTLAVDWDKAWQYWCRNESNFRRQQPGKFARTEGLPTSRDGDSQWTARLRGWRPGRYWNRGDWGPDPTEPGCRAPAAVLTTWRQEAMQ